MITNIPILSFSRNNRSSNLLIYSVFSALFIFVIGTLLVNFQQLSSDRLLTVIALGGLLLSLILLIVFIKHLKNQVNKVVFYPEDVVIQQNFKVENISIGDIKDFEILSYNDNEYKIHIRTCRDKVFVIPLVTLTKPVFNNAGSTVFRPEVVFDIEFHNSTLSIEQEDFKISNADEYFKKLSVILIELGLQERTYT